MAVDLSAYRLQCSGCLATKLDAETRRRQGDNTDWQRVLERDPLTPPPSYEQNLDAPLLHRTLEPYKNPNELIVLAVGGRTEVKCPVCNAVLLSADQARRMSDG